MNPANDLDKTISQHIDNYLKRLEHRAENMHALIMCEVERILIREALKHNQQNHSHTAQWLGLSRNTLKKKLIEYGYYHPDNPLNKGRKKKTVSQNT